MTVRLIAATMPTTDFFEETGAHTAEDLVSYCARVSNPGNQDNFDTSEKLLKYCMKKKHWSIFDMVHMVMEIKTTRDIGRQILRHRSFTFQEFSQRYAAVKLDSFELREARLQDNKNRQNSLATDDPELMRNWEIAQWDVAREAKRAYEWALDNGIAKEQARAVLPEGLTPSVMYMAGSLRNWIHYCQVRCGNDTQKEHRLIALDCFKIIADQFPFLKDLMDDNNS